MRSGKLYTGRSQRFLYIALTSVLLIAVPALVLFTIALKNPTYADMPKEIINGTQIQNLTDDHETGAHAWIDQMVFGLGRTLNADQRFFRNGTTSPDFDRHVAAVRFFGPLTITPGLHELEVETLAGTMHPAYRVYHWYGDTVPTLIYNHGASQVPFDAIFVSIFDDEVISQPLPVNLIVIRSPYHRYSRTELNAGAATLNGFLAIMAVSVRLTEELIQTIRARGVPTVEVAGISLGGFVANRHHLLYNSADYYVPVVAGTAFDAVFLHTSPAADDALQNPENIRRHLNFTDQWARTDNRNVFPVLARYDQVCLLQHQGPGYGDIPVEVWDTGHISTALSVRALRHIFLRHLLPPTELTQF
ncbi:MAG: hypothetical protein KDK34_06920 [Leptospiraceae bacterium]|nr:hypothetical protein [Leptospiraceae bacterium]